MFLSSCVHGGGVGHSLATYLQHESHRIEPVVVMPEPGVVANRFTPDVDVHFVPEFVERIQRPPYEWMRRGPCLSVTGGVAAVLQACRRVTELARRIRPDVIYCNHMLAKPIGAFAGARTGIPVVFHARNVHVHPVSVAFYRWIASFDATKLVIANSEAAAKPYRVATTKRVELVPNGVDLDRFGEGTVTPSLRRELGLGPERRIIGYMGRLVPKKGIEVLLHAFARIYESCPQAELVLVGGNDSGQTSDQRRRYEQLAQQLGVADRTHFLGFRDDVRPYLADFDVLTLPSVEPESFGRTLIEGMAYGIPAVTSRHGGAMDVVRHGVNGLWADPGDAGDLALQLERLMSDRELSREMGLRGRALARTTYDARSVSARITKLIHRVAGVPERPEAPSQAPVPGPRPAPGSDSRAPAPAAAAP